MLSFRPCKIKHAVLWHHLLRFGVLFSKPVDRESKVFNDPGWSCSDNSGKTTSSPLVMGKGVDTIYQLPGENLSVWEWASSSGQYWEIQAWCSASQSFSYSPWQRKSSPLVMLSDHSSYSWAPKFSRVQKQWCMYVKGNSEWMPGYWFYWFIERMK